jgi:hypothetical protein
MAASQGLMRKVDNLKFRMDVETDAEAASYMEVSSESEPKQREKIFISGIKGVQSTARIAQRMRADRGMFLVSIREVMKNEEFRPCIERIKKDCKDNNYEMAMIENEWIMMLPKNSGMEMVAE